MSDKNKIAIVFEALGIDKIVTSAKNLITSFINVDKQIANLDKNTSTFNDEIKRLTGTTDKAGASFVNIQKELKVYNEVSGLSVKNTSEQENSFNNLGKVLTAQKEAYNSLIKDALSQGEVKIKDLIDINTSFKDSLEALKKEYGDISTSSKEYQELQKELNGSYNILEKSNKDLQSAINNSQTSFQNIDKIIKETNESLVNQHSVLSNVKTGFMSFVKSGGNVLDTIGKFVPGIAGIQMGFNAVKNVVGGAISTGKEFSEALDKQNKSIQQMSLAISKNSKLTFESNNVFMDFASELQKTTAYGDEFTMSLIQIGAQGGHNEETIKRLTQVSLDLATTTGGDAAGAMKALSSGMNDAAKIMAQAEQAGIGFTQAEKKMISELQSTGKQAEATAIALGKIEKSVGGSAQKEIETFAGKQKQLGNIMGDVKEEFGRVAQALAKPFLNKATETIQKFFDILKDPKVVEPIQKIITAFHIIGDVVKSVVVDFVIPHIRNLFNWFTVGPQIVFNGIKNIVNAITDFAGNSGVQFNKFSDYIKVVVGGIINFGNIAMTTFKGIGNTFDKVLKLDFAGAKEEIANTTKSLGESFKKFVNPDELIKNTDNVINYMKSKYDEVQAHWKEPLEIPKPDSSNLDDYIDSSSKKEKESKEKTFAELLKEREAYQTADIEAINSSFAITKQILESETSLTKQQKKELQNELKQQADKEKEIKLNTLQDVQKMYQDELRKQVAEGKKASDATVKIYNDEGKEIAVNILSEMQSVDKEIKAMTTSSGDAIKDLKSKIGEVMNSLGSIAGSAMKLIQGSLKANTESLASYDEAIQISKDKQIEALRIFDERWKESQDKKKEISEEDNTAYMERLETELQRSLEASDILSAHAIQNKMNELNKKKAEEKKKKEADDKAAIEKAEKEDKRDAERKKIETQTNFEIATAEYNRAMGEYNNNVALAEMEKSKAIADAGISTAQAIMNAALMPLQPGFSLMGPAGVFTGIGMAATALTAVMGAIGGIQSASANLDSVKATTPTPPKFSYGTSGYSLKNGESAIVGEQGAEMVRQKAGGELEVISTNKTKNKTNENSNQLVNIIINVKELVPLEILSEYMRSLKDRDFTYALQ